MRVLSRLGACLLVAGVATAANADIIIDSNTLPIEEISSYQVSVDSEGRYTINIVTNDGDWKLEKNGVTSTPAVTLNFSANPTTVDEAGMVTFTWTSENADTCLAVDGNGGWQATGFVPVNGTATLPMFMLNPPPFRITCEGEGFAPTTRSIVITVIPDNPVTPPPGPNNCGAPEVSFGNVVTWEDFWGGQSFPAQDIVEKTQRLGRNEYIAIEFNTADFNGLGRLKTIQISNGVRNIAISECPGVFVQDVPAACFDEQSNGPGLFYSTDGSQLCNLDKNKLYYANITYSDVDDVTAGSTFCSSSSCVFNLNSATVEQ